MLGHLLFDGSKELRNGMLLESAPHGIRHQVTFCLRLHGLHRRDLPEGGVREDLGSGKVHPLLLQIFLLRRRERYLRTLPVSVLLLLLPPLSLVEARLLPETLTGRGLLLGASPGCLRRTQHSLPGRVQHLGRRLLIRRQHLVHLRVVERHVTAHCLIRELLQQHLREGSMPRQARSRARVGQVLAHVQENGQVQGDVPDLHIGAEPHDRVQVLVRELLLEVPRVKGAVPE
mmetsp:Transcript_158888/g.509553  ORF Transcript_158888/g.509553 Transcript_158888/m.509553 type:complete len:231 (-) Transcript_158888:8902-9594(-)